MFLILLSSDVGINGATRGILLCGNVIIPSLFPFTVCVLYIINSGALSRLKFVECFSKKLFGQNGDMFFVMLLSMIGGYPVGARLINTLLASNKITRRTSHIMQCYCVNAGPAFIVLAIGSGVLNSIKLGAILLASHIFSSFLIAICCSRFYKNVSFERNHSHKRSLSFSDNFVKSTADASNSVLLICAFVILFSVISAYLANYSSLLPVLEPISYIFEVTTAVTKINNVILISFLLGFGGFSVWFQVVAASGKGGVNLPLFAFSRIIHGIISALLTAVIIKVFKISVSTLSNNLDFKFKYTTSGISVSVSLAIMLILFLIFLSAKNHSRKTIDDML